ncbi:MAG: nucleotide exchange factor GrpE [Cyanosarcina radialis HA8281-LM2]|jgi:molecular chaperone GrpE (heat shock protein)|nr:nucleotide exchange factor GrpE [Cyanosarcina radialis HA8281-LM2]
MSQDYTYQLRQLMQRVGVSTFKQLSHQAGVSLSQIRRLRQGLVLEMPAKVLLQLSRSLQISLTELLTTFGEVNLSDRSSIDQKNSELTPNSTIQTLQQEYQRLQVQLERQRESLNQEFQQASLQVLESWMLQWPTVAHAVEQNPDLPAVKLLKLVRPIEQLLQQWGVEAIAPVGSNIPYDPQLHQLMSGTAQPGETVQVRYAGYRQGDKLLYRAKVSPVI